MKNKIIRIFILYQLAIKSTKIKIKEWLSWYYTDWRKHIFVGGLVLIITVFASLTMYAQQNPQYSQYIFNGLVINPAYAGSKNVLNLNGLFRTQWTSIDGAPTTQTLSIDGPAFSNTGLGFHAINDNAGALHNLAFYGSYAYRIKTGENSRLSLGLAVGASQFSLDPSKLLTDPDSPIDPSIAALKKNQILPDAKAGLYFNTERFYAGIAVSDILSQLDFEKNTGLKQDQHYFLTTGVVMDLGERFKFKPSILLKENFKSPTNIDFNAFVLFNEKIWLGASYRTGARLFENTSAYKALNLNDAIAVMIEVYATDKFRIGYGYDIPMSQFNYGSNEISLGYYFFKKQDIKTVTPRYF